jgi:hypothetical protein
LSILSPGDFVDGAADIAEIDDVVEGAVEVETHDDEYGRIRTITSKSKWPILS